MKVCNNNVAAIEAVLVTDVRAIHSAKWQLSLCRMQVMFCRMTAVILQNAADVLQNDPFILQNDLSANW